MAKSGSARRRARRMRERGIDPVPSIAPRPRVNIDLMRKQTASAFIHLLQQSGQIPVPCPDGIMPARFGDWVWLMQFDAGSPVGVLIVHLLEAAKFVKNFGIAAEGVDFASLMNVAAKSEDPLLVEEQTEEGDPESLTPPA